MSKPIISPPKLDSKEQKYVQVKPGLSRKERLKLHELEQNKSASEPDFKERAKAKYSGLSEESSSELLELIQNNNEFGVRFFILDILSKSPHAPLKFSSETVTSPSPYNTYDISHSSLLDEAVRAGRLVGPSRTVELLLTYDSLKKFIKDYNPFILAIDLGNTDIAGQLITADPSIVDSPHPCDPVKRSASHFAVEKGDPKILKFLLEQCHASPSVVDAFGHTLFDQCLISGADSLAEEFFDEDLRRYQCSELHQAVLSTDKEQVESLLNKDIGLAFALDSRGRSPFYYAEFISESIARIIFHKIMEFCEVEIEIDREQAIKKIADISRLHNPIMLIITYCEPERAKGYLQEFLAEGFQVNRPNSALIDPSLLTPLPQVILSKNFDLAKILLQYGADPDEVVNGDSILTSVFKQKPVNKNLVDLLLSYGARTTGGITVEMPYYYQQAFADMISALSTTSPSKRLEAFQTFVGDFHYNVMRGKSAMAKSVIQSLLNSEIEIAGQVYNGVAEFLEAS